MCKPKVDLRRQQPSGQSKAVAFSVNSPALAAGIYVHTE